MADAPITEVVGHVADLSNEIAAVDPVPMTAEERSSPHLRVRSEGGRELRVSLERGRELADGDILLIEEGVAFAVKASPEDLLRVVPEGAVQWGITGYQLGNLHRPVRFIEDAILTPYDPYVTPLLRELDVFHERVMTPFTGIRCGAITGHSH